MIRENGSKAMGMKNEYEYMSDRMCVHNVQYDMKIILYVSLRQMFLSFHWIILKYIQSRQHEMLTILI